MRIRGLIWAITLLGASYAHGLSLSEGVDAPTLSWSSGGQGSWTGQTGITHDGTDAIQSAAIPDNADSWVQTQLTGPGVLTFWWKVSCDLGGDFLQCYVGFDLQDSISGEVSWVRKTVVIPPGIHTVRWRYTKDLTGTGALDSAWLDQVSYVRTISLPDSLDVPWTTVTDGGQVGWFGQTNVTHQGSDAAQSGSVGNSQVSWMELTVNGPLTLSFWWKVSSEENFDFLEFYMGGILKKQVSGEMDWTEETFEIPEGSHTLRWQYNKDLSDSSGQDKAWVDALGIPEPLQLKGEILPDRAFLLKLTGVEAGKIYQVECSSNFNTWVPLSQFTGTVSEVWTLDVSAIGVPKRFYRAVTQ